MDYFAGLFDWLPLYGPWLVFVLAVLETSFVTGLVVPSGLATSVAAGLTLGGEGSLTVVVVAALAGGFVGDSVGFWIGWGMRHRLEEGEGRFAKTFHRHHSKLSGFFGRHPVYSVTSGRLVSFVRTLMPMAAGMSELSYRRYVAYEVPGLIGWAGIYVAVGLLAGESWRTVVGSLGFGGGALFVAVGIGLWLAMKKRQPGNRGAGSRQTW